MRLGELEGIRRWKTKLKRFDRPKIKVACDKLLKAVRAKPRCAKRGRHSSHTLCKLLCYCSNMSEIISHFHVLLSSTQVRKNRLNILARQRRLRLTSWWSQTRDFITLGEPSSLFSAAVFPLEASHFRVNISLSSPALENSRPSVMSSQHWCKWWWSLHWK